MRLVESQDTCLVEMQNKIYQKSFNIGENGGLDWSLGLLGGDPAAILTPRAAQTLKRQKIVVR